MPSPPPEPLTVVPKIAEPLYHRAHAASPYEFQTDKHPLVGTVHRLPYKIDNDTVFRQCIVSGYCPKNNTDQSPDKIFVTCFEVFPNFHPPLVLTVPEFEAMEKRKLTYEDASNLHLKYCTHQASFPYPAIRKFLSNQIMPGFTSRGPSIGFLKQKMTDEESNQVGELFVSDTLYLCSSTKFVSPPKFFYQPFSSRRPVFVRSSSFSLSILFLPSNS